MQVMSNLPFLTRLTDDLEVLRMAVLLTSCDDDVTPVSRLLCSHVVCTISEVLAFLDEMEGFERDAQ